MSPRRLSLVPCALSLPLALMASVACGGDPEPEAPAVMSESAQGAAAVVQLDGQERARIPEVLAERRGTDFSRSATVKDNARVFLSLVETERDPDVVTAALRALLITWTHNPRYQAQLQLVTPAYAQVVSARLDDEHPAVQAAALQAAAKCLQGEAPVRAVADHVVRLASEHPSAAGRHEALEVLWSSSEISSHPEQIAPFVRALAGPEPWLVSSALLRLSRFGAAWPEPAALRGRLLELLTHEDPGVRGRAATALASVVRAADPHRDEVARAILPLLSDAQGYTRSAGATALAWLDYRPAVHALVPLLDDSASSNYELRGYTRLDGSPGFQHHNGSPWSRVDDAAVRALQHFSGRLGTRFAFDVRQEQLDQDLAHAARTARAWYAAVRAELPPAPAARP